MWPWGHLAVGYLLYSGLLHVRGREPNGRTTLVLAFGTQFPDLVDKPLAWTVGVLPTGRSLGHSLLTATLVIALLAFVLHERNRDGDALAFGLGYLSHLFTDALNPLLAGEFYYLGYLAWPLVPPVEYDTEPSFLVHFANLEPTPSVVFGVVLTILTVVVWARDGAPGLAEVRAALGQLSRVLPAVRHSRR